MHGRPNRRNKKDLTAARTDLSLLVAVNTNWWYKDGMRLVERMNKRC